MERSTVMMDRQGRIYLPKNLKKDTERRFFVARIGKELLLVPIPADPVKELEALGKALPKRSLRQLRKEILHEAAKAV